MLRSNSDSLNFLQLSYSTRSWSLQSVNVWWLNFTNGVWADRMICTKPRTPAELYCDMFFWFIQIATKNYISGCGISMLNFFMPMSKFALSVSTIATTLPKIMGHIIFAHLNSVRSFFLASLSEFQGSKGTFTFLLKRLRCQI